MTSLFGRPLRRAVPPPGVTLDRGERLLVTDVTGDGAPIAATNHRLIVPTLDGQSSISWHTIERATFDQESGQLVITETAPVGTRPGRHRIAIEGAVALLDVIREQVKASVVLTRHVPIAGQRGIRVSGRRRPDSSLAWHVAVDAGLAVNDPEIRADIDRAIAAVRSELGS